MIASEKGRVRVQMWDLERAIWSNYKTGIQKGGFKAITEEGWCGAGDSEQVQTRDLEWESK